MLLLESKPFIKFIFGISLEMSLNELTDDNKIIISFKSKLNILLNYNILNFLFTILEGMIFLFNKLFRKLKKFSLVNLGYPP